MKSSFIFSLSLICSVYAQAQNLYGNLEQWRTVNVPSPNPVVLQAPVGWYDTDSVIFMANFIYPNANFNKQVFKTSSAHGGNFAAQITTVNQDVFGILPGLLCNAQPIINMATFDPNDPGGSLEFDGGTMLSQRVNSVSAWIKYLPKGLDTASIEVEAVLSGQGAGGNDSVVGSGIFFISHSYANYTSVNVPLSYLNTTVVPNKLLIFISSSGNSPKDSSTLFVDDIQASTTAVANIFSNNETVHIYPNPSAGIFNINTIRDESVRLDLYDMSGELTASRHFSGSDKIDVSTAKQGVYIYRISKEDGTMVQSGKMNIVK